MISTALWLDAADAGTIFASGSEVTQINDKSGNGRNFTSTSGTRPSTGIATLNSKNILSFDADFLTSASAASTWKFLHDSTGSSVFAIVKFGASSNPDAAYSLMGTNGFSSLNTGLTISYDDRVSQSRNNSILIFATLSQVGLFVLNNLAQDSVTPNNVQIISALTDPGNATAANRSIIRVNAGSELKNSIANSTSSTDNPTFTLQIGSTGASTAPLTGELAEIICISGIASTTNRQRIEGYLAHKWGLTANLPSDHPYKTVGPTP